MKVRRFVAAGLLVAAMALISACSQVSTSEDAAITKEVQANLYQDQTLKARNISVVTQGGTVVLTGQVQTPEEKAAAEQLASQASGVKKVVNELAIPGVPAERTASEARRGAAPPTKPVALTIPAGTVVSVRMIDGIDSRSSRPGAEFAASLVSPVAAGDRVVFSPGSNARVRLVQSRQAGHMKGSSELQVELASLSRGGKAYPVQSSAAVAKGKSRGKQTAKRVGGGAVVGGLIGGIAGGGKGAAIGAGAGAGAGALTQALTKGPKVQIPSEARLDFSLTAPVSVTLSP